MPGDTMFAPLTAEEVLVARSNDPSITWLGAAQAQGLDRR